MSKPLLGIAELLPATAKIYYESIFSEYQIGRAVDLICAIVAEEKIDTQTLRCALTAALTEACRNQSMLAHGEESRRRTTPVSVEVGIDGGSVSAAIGFYLGEAEAKTDSPLAPGTELRKNLENIRCFADVSSLNVEKSSGFAEIIFSLPAKQEKESGPLRCIFIQHEGPTPKAAEREYIELGDVEFTQLLDPRKDTAPKAETLLHSLSDAKKANLFADSDPSGAASLLRKSLKPEDIDKLIAESLGPQEKAKILASSMTPAEVEKLLKENLSAEDQAKILAEADPENTVTVIKDVVTRTKVEKVVVQGEPGPLSDDSAQTISGSASPSSQADTPSQAASGTNSDKSELSLLEEARALAQDEPEIAIAALKKSTSPAQLKKLLKNASASMSRNTTAQAIIEALSPEELNRAILSTFSPEEMGKLVAAQMKPSELREAICAGLSKAELAKVLTSVLPKEQYEKALSDALPAEEIAHTLSEGLPQEQFAKLLASTLPEEKLKQAVQQKQKAGTPFTPEQFELTTEQVRVLLDTTTSPEQAVDVLSKVMPRKVAQSLFTGTIPKTEVSSALEGFLPNAALAPEVATLLLSKSDTKPDSKPDSSKTIEFYIARARSLEIRLKTLEAQKNAAEQEARSLRSRGKDNPEKSFPVATPKNESTLVSTASPRTSSTETPLSGAPLTEATPTEAALTEEAAIQATSTENADSLKAPEPEIELKAEAQHESTKEPKSTTRPPRTSSEEVEQEFELEAQKLEQNLQGVIQTIEQLKDEFPDEKSKKQVEGMLTQVLLEKAKINELSLELSAVFRKKEHTFRNREATLVEELRQSKQLVNQRNSNIERMKELMSRMQLKMKTESESSGENAVSETQMRVKYEHSQRQIDSLKEEIERLNRRAQNSMSSQQSAAQQRELAKLQKEAAGAVKALATKKQEIDLIKRQLNERDAREAELKRTILRLQNEVAAAKATAHSAAKKPAA